MDQAIAVEPWETHLSQTLRSLRRERRRPLRVAIVGLGDQDRGDDGAGCCVLEQMRALRCDRLLLQDGRQQPEVVAAALRHFVPDLVLLVDAGRFGEQPGNVRWLRWEQVLAEANRPWQDELLAPLVAYVREELGCPVVVLGIQCHQSVIPDYMTPAVARGAFHLAARLEGLLPQFIFM